MAEHYTSLTMSEGEFDRFVSIAERDHRLEAIAGNDAFVALMNRAIKRGREKAAPGTFVDLTAPIGARRIVGDVIVSSHGSPAAMCMESGHAGGATETLK